jgi:hypothetical protein
MFTAATVLIVVAQGFFLVASVRGNLRYWSTGLALGVVALVLLVGELR